MTDLVVAARYFDLPSAMVARSYLDSQGIFAVTPKYHFAATNWHMMFALQAMRVMVREEDVLAARELLATQEPGWETSPACGSDRIYRYKSLIWSPLSIFMLVMAHVATAFVKHRTKRHCRECFHEWIDEMKPETDPKQTPLLLIGSIPLHDADAVLDAVADTIGARLASVPDGETGVRSNWIGWQHAVFALQDALEQGTEKERAYQLNPPYRFAPGKSAADIDFGELGFAREAIKSYAAFAARRAAGRFAHDARFQVCLPTPFAPAFAFCAYDIQGDLRLRYSGRYLSALRTRNADGDRCDPARHPGPRSCHPVGCCDRNVDFRGAAPGAVPRRRPTPWLIATLARLGNAVPDAITLGYHLCYGSMGNKHWKEPEDHGIYVSTANAISKGVNRQIDFFHVPVPVDRDDNAYFSPLGDLSIAKETLV